MDKKRRPIRKKIQLMVMGLSVAALVLTSAAGIISMMRIQSDSEKALINQMEHNLRTIIEDKASLADSDISKYVGYLQNCADYAHSLYMNPENYAPKMVMPPLMGNAGVFAMQRYLNSHDITFETVSGEIALLGNLEQVFDPVIRYNKNIITTIYAGTKSGFMVDYDAQSELAENVDRTEQYYDFFSYDWYSEPKKTEGFYFSEVYWDEFRETNILTCAVPFYDADNNFAGVIGMDILISDLHKEIVNVDIGEGAQAFLVNKSGKVIAEEGESSQNESRTIFDDPDATAVIISDILNDKTGISLTESNIYYAYTPIKLTNWKLCVKIPESTILSPVRSVNRNIIMTILLFTAVFAVIIIAVVFIARAFSARLTNPIIALDHDVEKISAGNLDYRAEVHDNDEIGDLAQRFNDMAVSLKEYIRNLASVTAEKERIGAELNIATQIQADMLPRIFPPFPDRTEFEIYATMTPAKEVGGDFYDFFLIDDDHLGLVIADVSGKGVPAALFMVIAKTLIKNRALMGGGSPGEILADVNNQLCEGNDADLFVTVWLGILELSTGRVRASNAGHEFPAIRRANGTYELFKTKQSPAVATMEGLKFREAEFTLGHGDSLYIYTDGVPEATNIHEELYGTERMIDVLNTTIDMPMSDVLKTVKKAVDDFTGEAPQFDDITMVGLQFFGGEIHELEVNADTEELDRVLEFIDSHLEEWECPIKTQTQMNIAVEEIFVNIAHYAFENHDGKAKITIQRKGQDVEIIFSDDGVPYNPLAREDPDITLSAEDRQIGGLGIYIVKKSMNSVSYEYRDNHNILTIHKAIE